MENAQPFIGIDPDDTEQVPIGGAVVTIGVLDQGLWARIEDEDSLLYRAALRRITKYLSDIGEDPAAAALDREGKPIVLSDSQGNPLPLNRAAMMITEEPEYAEALHRLSLRAVKYSVRAHSGWVRRDGTPVPLEVVDEKLDFGVVKALSPNTLRFYAANRVLLTGLWLAIRRLQTLGPREKKVSPRVSLQTFDASAVSIAPTNPSSSG